MKNSHWLLILASSLLWSACGLAAENQAGEVTPATQESPIACDRTALTPAQRTRQRELGVQLRKAVLATREVADGFEFDFPADAATFRVLTEYVPLERACCPFFEFNIRLDREGGPLHWRLSGREGVKAFIREEVRWLFKE